MVMPLRDKLKWGGGLALLVLALISLQANLKPGAERNWLDRLLVGATAPIQNVLVWSVEGVGGLWDRYVDLVDVREERDGLAVERARLVRELTQAREELKEKQRLQALLGFAEEHPRRYLGARIVAVGADPLLRTVRIDRGRSDGVRDYQPVASSCGVVGRVLVAADGYADVLLLTDRNCAIAALVGEGRARATVAGSGEDDVPCRLEYLRRKAEAADGDEVVTSGLDGIFPKGLLIGRVTSVRRPDYGLFQQAEVEPAADLDTLEEVLVVVGEEVGP